jgi:hypothetical protein
MRGFLIFLAFAIPIVLANPIFWSIVRMETSAERVGYTTADGVTQWAWIGPESPWPDWALVPAGARLRVQSHYEPAPGHPALGMADVDIRGEAGEIIDAYARVAEAAGWSVAFYRLDTISPDLPPHPLRLCMVEAQRDGRILTLSLEQRGERSLGGVHWIDGEREYPMRAPEGRC